MGGGGWNGQPTPDAGNSNPFPGAHDSCAPPPHVPLSYAHALQAATPSSTAANRPGPSQGSGCGAHHDSRGCSVGSSMPRRSCTQRATARAPEASAWLGSGACRGCRTLGSHGGTDTRQSGIPLQKVQLHRDSTRRGKQPQWAARRWAIREPHTHGTLHFSSGPQLAWHEHEGGRVRRGFGTRPQYLIVCLWRRLLASRHCPF